MLISDEPVFYLNELLITNYEEVAPLFIHDVWLSR